jgi:hypothetical protein
MSLHKQLVQIAIIAVCGAVTMFLLAWWLDGFTVSSIGSAILMTGALLLVQSIYWWVFINFFTWLPVWLYPIVSFLLSGLSVYIAGEFVPGITVDSIWTGLWISFWFTAVSAVVGAALSLDMDSKFDRNVTRKLVERRGKPVETDVPGFIFLEIDGLSEKLFRKALAEGYMPTLKSWIDRGTHTITGWETDFSAQTGSMQPGILLGNNEGIPAYRWWDRSQGKMVMSGDPRDLVSLEGQLSRGNGLLSDGGASRGNMYSGDATESLMTYSTMMQRSRQRSPGFYAYLISPFVIGRLLTRYFMDVFREWWEASAQRRRQDKYRVSARNIPYAFFRALLGPLLQDLITYTVISDMVRGVPAVYALYPAYDDVAHFAGMQTEDAFKVLTETDHYFSRVEKALEFAPRPYHLIVLSDHGQSEGPTFEAAHGMDLKKLVETLVSGEQVFGAMDTNEMWDNVNGFLTESVNADSRTAKVLRSALRSKTREDGTVNVGPEEKSDEQKQAQESNIIVMGSGSTGLINFRNAPQRMTYEQIQASYPDLILGLVSHPGIGWVLVRSSENGDMVIGRKGIYFLDKDEFEGENPLADYSPNAPRLLKRETSFEHCPDLLVNTKYDPVTEELCGFENQASHHGGLGGPQNHAFILHPVELKAPDEPIVGAQEVHRTLHGWRNDSVGGTLTPARTLVTDAPVETPTVGVQ